MGESSQLYCLIRKEPVAPLPEERVRQRLLQYMISELGFPAPLITVEQPIRLIPGLDVSYSRRVPDRRADIVCFAKNKDQALVPLLLVECKAVPLTSKVINQVLGYNHFVRSRFIALVNQDEIRMGWYDEKKGGYEFIDFLPSYASLVSQGL